MATSERTHMRMDNSNDRAEAVLRTIDNSTANRAGISFFHIMALVSIVASVVLFFAGKRTEAIFVGLWPPTFEALKSASEHK